MFLHISGFHELCLPEKSETKSCRAVGQPRPGISNLDADIIPKGET